MTTNLSPIVDWTKYSERVNELVDRLPAVPRRDLKHFFEQAEKFSQDLPSEILERIESFRTDSNDDGYLLIRGLPVDTSMVPGTPEGGPEPPQRRLLAAEGWLALIGSRLGLATGYRGSWHGSILQDVVPSRSAAHKAVGSPLSQLRFHTDMPYHRHQPDYALLACSRTDPNSVAATMVSSARRILPNLSRSDIALLRERSIPCLLDVAFRASDGPARTVAVRVVSGSENDPILAYDRELLQPDDDQTRAALARLSTVVDETAQGQRWRPGDVLVVDVRRTTYACIPYTVTGDQRDRWLHRVFIRDPRRRPDVMNVGEVVPL